LLYCQRDDGTRRALRNGGPVVPSRTPSWRMPGCPARRGALEYWCCTWSAKHVRARLPGLCFAYSMRQRHRSIQLHAVRSTFGLLKNYVIPSRSFERCRFSFLETTTRNETLDRHTSLLQVHK